VKVKDAQDNLLLLTGEVEPGQERGALPVQQVIAELGVCQRGANQSLECLLLRRGRKWVAQQRLIDAGAKVHRGDSDQRCYVLLIVRRLHRSQAR